MLADAGFKRRRQRDFEVDPNDSPKEARKLSASCLRRLSAARVGAGRAKKSWPPDVPQRPAANICEVARVRHAPFADAQIMTALAAETVAPPPRSLMTRALVSTEAARTRSDASLYLAKIFNERFVVELSPL